MVRSQKSLRGTITSVSHDGLSILNIGDGGDYAWESQDSSLNIGNTHGQAWIHESQIYLSNNICMRPSSKYMTYFIFFPILP